MRGSSWLALAGPGVVAASLALAGCGGAAAPKPAAAAKPAAKPKAEARVEVTAKKKESPEEAEARLLATIRDGKDVPQGGAILSFSEARRRGNNLAPRSPVEPVSFKVKELPLVDIPEPLSASKAPAELPAGEEAKELWIDWRGVEPARVGPSWTTVRVSLHGEPLGRVKIGGNEAAVAANGGGGVYVTCGSDGAKSGKPVVMPARWETLTLSASRATARYTVVDGWFDARTCKATVVRRTVVDARGLPGGILFGFRDDCVASASSPASSSRPDAKGEESTDKCGGPGITLLGPRVSHVVANGVGGEARSALGSFSRVTLPIRRGGGGSLIERVSSQNLQEWLGPGASRRPTGDVVLGVEIVQTVDDPEPIAVSYVSDPR